MGWRAIFVAVLGAMAVASPAHAITLVTPEGQTAQPYQRWADRAHVPTPPLTVTVIRAPCPDVPQKSCAIWPATIYLRPHDPAIPRRVARAWAHRDVLHELGHVFDYALMTDPARFAFGQIIHDARPWRSPQPPASVHEKFAETYRLCAQYRRLPFTASIGYFEPDELSRRRLAKACALIRQQTFLPW